MASDEQATGDGQLVAAARSDPAAFARLYRGHYDGVFRYCVHRLFDRSAAEDVTATVFLKVVENFHVFEGNGRDFRNWLYRIATNAVNEHLRNIHRGERLLRSAAENIHGRADRAATADDQAENLAVLERALLTLRPRYQTIIALRFFESLSTSEIAAILRSRPGTVRSQLSRALASLREAMAGGEKGAWREA